MNEKGGKTPSECLSKSLSLIYLLSGFGIICLLWILWKFNAEARNLIISVFKTNFASKQNMGKSPQGTSCPPCMNIDKMVSVHGRAGTIQPANIREWLGQIKAIALIKCLECAELQAKTLVC